MKRSNPYHWMPLSIEQCDLNKIIMPPNIFGAWILLNIHHWRTGLPLPNDSRKLSAIAGLDLRTFKKHRNLLLGGFQKIRNKYVDHLLMSELQRCKQISDKRRAAINSRWNKADTNVLQMNNNCNTNSCLNVSVHDVSPPGAKSKKPEGSK